MTTTTTSLIAGGGFVRRIRQYSTRRRRRRKSRVPKEAEGEGPAEEQEEPLPPAPGRMAESGRHTLPGTSGSWDTPMTTEPRKKRFQPFRVVRKIFRRKSKSSACKEDEEGGGGGDGGRGGHTTHLKSRSTSELLVANCREDRRGEPDAPHYTTGLSLSHDSIFAPESEEADPRSREKHFVHSPKRFSVKRFKEELLSKFRPRQDSDDDDAGLPRSPCTSPTTVEILHHGLKGKSEKFRSSDGSLLSMGSSGTDTEDYGCRQKLVFDRLPVNSDPDLNVGATQLLDNQAARHKIAVRPRRTHAVTVNRRVKQVSTGVSLPTTPEDTEEVPLPAAVGLPRPRPRSSGKTESPVSPPVRPKPSVDKPERPIGIQVPQSAKPPSPLVEVAPETAEEKASAALQVADSKGSRSKSNAARQKRQHEIEKFHRRESYEGVLAAVDAVVGKDEESPTSPNGAHAGKRQAFADEPPANSCFNMGFVADESSPPTTINPEVPRLEDPKSEEVFAERPVADKMRLKDNRRQQRKMVIADPALANDLEDPTPGEQSPLDAKNRRWKTTKGDEKAEDVFKTPGEMPPESHAENTRLTDARHRQRKMRDVEEKKSENVKKDNGVEAAISNHEPVLPEERPKQRHGKTKGDVEDKKSDNNVPVAEVSESLVGPLSDEQELWPKRHSTEPRNNATSAKDSLASPEDTNKVVIMVPPQSSKVQVSSSEGFSQMQIPPPAVGRRPTNPVSRSGSTRRQSTRIEQLSQNLFGVLSDGTTEAVLDYADELRRGAQDGGRAAIPDEPPMPMTNGDRNRSKLQGIVLHVPGEKGHSADDGIEHPVAPDTEFHGAMPPLVREYPEKKFGGRVPAVVLPQADRPRRPGAAKKAVPSGSLSESSTAAEVGNGFTNAPNRSKRKPYHQQLSREDIEQLEVEKSAIEALPPPVPKQPPPPKQQESREPFVNPFQKQKDPTPPKQPEPMSRGEDAKVVRELKARPSLIKPTVSNESTSPDPPPAFDFDIVICETPKLSPPTRKISRPEGTTRLPKFEILPYASSATSPTQNLNSKPSPQRVARADSDTSTGSAQDTPPATPYVPRPILPPRRIDAPVKTAFVGTRDAQPLPVVRGKDSHLANVSKSEDVTVVLQNRSRFANEDKLHENTNNNNSNVKSDRSDPASKEPKSAEAEANTNLNPPPPLKPTAMSKSEKLDPSKELISSSGLKPGKGDVVKSAESIFDPDPDQEDNEIMKVLRRLSLKRTSAADRKQAMEAAMMDDEAEDQTSPPKTIHSPSSGSSSSSSSSVNQRSWVGSVPRTPNADAKEFVIAAPTVSRATAVQQTKSSRFTNDSQQVVAAKMEDKPQSRSRLASDSHTANVPKAEDVTLVQQSRLRFANEDKPRENNSDVRVSNSNKGKTSNGRKSSEDSSAAAATTNVETKMAPFSQRSLRKVSLNHAAAGSEPSKKEPESPWMNNHTEKSAQKILVQEPDSMRFTTKKPQKIVIQEDKPLKTTVVEPESPRIILKPQKIVIQEPDASRIGHHEKSLSKIQEDKPQRLVIQEPESPRINLKPIQDHNASESKTSAEPPKRPQSFSTMSAAVAADVLDGDGKVRHGAGLNGVPRASGAAGWVARNAKPEPQSLKSPGSPKDPAATLSLPGAGQAGNANGDHQKLKAAPKFADGAAAEVAPSWMKDLKQKNVMKKQQTAAPPPTIIIENKPPAPTNRSSKVLDMANTFQHRVTS